MTNAKIFRGNTIDISYEGGVVHIMQVPDEGVIREVEIVLDDGPDIEVLYGILGDVLATRYPDIVVDQPTAEEIGC